jgi:RNA-directed DNA polymerase
MQESYGKGVATHLDPESCVVVREDGGEALTGARVGQVLSREIVESLRGADVLAANGRQHRLHRYREVQPDPARSETLRMLGNVTHGNREIPRPPAAKVADRAGKSKDVRRR